MKWCETNHPHPPKLYANIYTCIINSDCRIGVSWLQVDFFLMQNTRSPQTLHWKKKHRNSAAKRPINFVHSCSVCIIHAASHGEGNELRTWHFKWVCPSRRIRSFGRHRLQPPLGMDCSTLAAPTQGHSLLGEVCSIPRWVWNPSLTFALGRGTPL